MGRPPLRSIRAPSPTAQPESATAGWGFVCRLPSLPLQLLTHVQGRGREGGYNFSVCILLWSQWPTEDGSKVISSEFSGLTMGGGLIFKGLFSLIQHNCQIQDIAIQDLGHRTPSHFIFLNMIHRTRE